MSVRKRSRKHHYIGRIKPTTRKGQVTIPIEIRRVMGIKEGDRVSFIADENGVRLKARGSVTERTAGMFRGAGPVLSAEELRVAAEVAIAEDVMRRSGA
jgi:AbrB family looped-hinge helix DNA binding protein